MKKRYLKPFGAAVIASVALSVTAGTMIVSKAVDNTPAFEISTESPTEAETSNTITREYYTVHDNGIPVTLAEGYQDHVYAMCEKYGISGYEQLVVAMLYKESSFNPNAISKSNDYGMAQINIGNHDWLREELGVTDFLNPYESIECGVFMLSEALQRNGYSIQKALVAYNAGQSKVNAGMTENAHSNKVLDIIGNMTTYSVELVI